MPCELHWYKRNNYNIRTTNNIEKTVFEEEPIFYAKENTTNF